jgi:2-polyprenyl-3-methyl-5-hydroxy-6-metoxy-1,4-benzoquinol methylase
MKKEKLKFLGRFFGSTFSRMNFRRMEECASVIEWLNTQPGERILDIGCGDGYYNKLIAKKGAKVVGIDIHEKRLSIAQTYRANKDIEFLYMDAEKMDFPDAYFDKVMSLCVIEHLSNDDLVMQNISKAIKPGGDFVFSADSLSHPSITPKQRARHKIRYAVNTFYTNEIVHEKLSRAGFDIEKTRYIMNTRFALSMTRISWKIDDLPVYLKFLGSIGYLSLGLIWKISTLFPKKTQDNSIGGLTLLVHAKKKI